MSSPFAAYLHFLRVAYLTLCDKNSRGAVTARAPAHFAGKTIFACVFFHVAALAMIAIALTGGIRGLSETAMLAAIMLPLFLIVVWETLYVEQHEALVGISKRLSSESEAERLRRYKRVSWFVWGSYVAFLVGMGAIMARAFLEHRASLST